MFTTTRCLGAAGLLAMLALSGCDDAALDAGPGTIREASAEGSAGQLMYLRDASEVQARFAGGPARFEPARTWTTSRSTAPRGATSIASSKKRPSRPTHPRPSLRRWPPACAKPMRRALPDSTSERSSPTSPPEKAMSECGWRHRSCHAKTTA